jgi:putative oxidoreductase
MTHEEHTQASASGSKAPKMMLAPRVLGGAPLLFFGVMHLVGAMPMEPIVEAAGLPMPSVMAILAPIAQVAAGLMLLFGVFARFGALLAIGTMVGAVVTHLKIPNDQWPMPTELDPNAVGAEPTAMLGLAGLIVICSIMVLLKGAGAWSFDSRTR